MLMFINVLFMTIIIQIKGTPVINNIAKDILKNSRFLPILYNDKYHSMSIEHVYPKCYLKKEHYNDFHNMFKSSKYFNNLRSNYVFSDQKNMSWISINNDNYISHKHKLFNPRDCDKGIIARAILYMSYEYNYKLFIDKNILYNWCIKYQPTINEKFHNIKGYAIQGNHNIFISNYNKHNYFYFLKDYLYN